jgi:uncharacterized membrane protein YjgN (DUF898 family)
VTENFAFTGKAREYFRVWIVNLFLTVVTLGLYSPWAKVRRKRYLHGHTWLAGSNFDYHGDPWAILRGRLVAVAAFLLYTTTTHFSPRAGAAVLLVLMPAVPWLILRSFAFNAANTSWRHLRFGFEGRYSGALRAVAPFALVPLATLLLPLPEPGRPTLRNVALILAPGLMFGLAYPYARARLAVLHIGGSRYGGEIFRCTVRVRSFYGIYMKAFFVTLLLALGIGGAVVLLGMFAARRVEEPELLSLAIIGAYVVVLATGLGYSQARTSNLLMNATRLGGLGLRSKLSAKRLMSLYIGNVLAIAATLGLAVPWAVVRTLRYRAACLGMEGDGSLDAFAAPRGAQAVSATGEELGEMFALDLSL